MICSYKSYQRMLPRSVGIVPSVRPLVMILDQNNRLVMTWFSNTSEVKERLYGLVIFHQELSTHLDQVLLLIFQLHIVLNIEIDHPQ